MRKFALVSAVIAFALLGVSYLIRAAFPGGADSFAATSTDDPCDLLTSTEVERLAGESLAPAATTVTGLSACQWGTPAELGVTTINVSAADLAAQLPELVEELRESASDSPDTRRRVEEALQLISSDRENSPDQACDLFGSVMEVLGVPFDAPRAIRVQPTKRNPLAIGGQVCARGRYTMVLLVAPDLNGSRVDVARMSAALTSARHLGTG